MCNVTHNRYNVYLAQLVADPLHCCCSRQGCNIGGPIYHELNPGSFFLLLHRNSPYCPVLTWPCQGWQGSEMWRDVHNCRWPGALLLLPCQPWQGSPTSTIGAGLVNQNTHNWTNGPCQTRHETLDSEWSVQFCKISYSTELKDTYNTKNKQYSTIKQEQYNTT